MALLARLLRNLPLLVLSPILWTLAALFITLADIAFRLIGRTRPPSDTMPDTSAASVVIPNWNGRDLLEKYLPPLIEAMAGNPRNEIVVVDNGSADGSADFVRGAFPSVRLVALPENLGFGGGSNRGFQEAKNDIVVLLNSDMRVDRGFLQPLLDAFTDEKVFAVSSQIFFSDPGKKREETGLTQAWWSSGFLRVRHVEDDQINEPFPCFYPGGGSSAIDRRKFLSLGGFDHLLRPFYLEDTDIGYMAWKRGWKVYYQPASKVWHEHRGTIGKKFSQSYIDGVLYKNLILFCWKNIHSFSGICSHLLNSWIGAVLSVLAGHSMERATLGGQWRALLQAPGALRSRWRARSLAVVEDAEAFRRSLGGYHRDRFHQIESAPERLNVLFISPYPISPPLHGGGVFMNQTVRHLGRLTNLHLVVLVDSPNEICAHDELEPFTKTQEFLVRLEGLPAQIGSIQPFAVREFASKDLEWLIHRQIYLHRIHAVQVEYTNMGQYAGPYNRLAWFLFEHDIYFQSISRGLGSMKPVARIKGAFEYLRALRYELALLPVFDRVQTCTEENKDYLASFLPELAPRIDPHLRAGIDVSAYRFTPDGRRPKTMLFLGSFRHEPNRVALNWFLKHILPAVLAAEPDSKLIVIGSDPPPAHTLPDFGGALEMQGFVADIKSPLRECAVFVCPILSGSGIRVKLLEAFASGIPAVSTTIGAEGLTGNGLDICRVADSPDAFAREILRLFENPDDASALARRARGYVEEERDMARITAELETAYRATLNAKARRPC
ncbi:MAG: glycosyl transferase [Candidatus Solibacter sp.]|nr:glycosyl transferase [Candidatus Solibacter sp.]